MLQLYFHVCVTSVTYSCILSSLEFLARSYLSVTYVYQLCAQVICCIAVTLALTRLAAGLLLCVVSFTAMPILAVLAGFALGRRLTHSQYLRQLRQHASQQVPGSFLSLLR